MLIRLWSEDKVLLNWKVNTDVRSFKLDFKDCQNRMQNNNRFSGNKL